MITRLCESLGLCPAHTRGLLGQPGADSRLTAVYRYVLRAAVTSLAARASLPAPCPACAHDAESAERALDTLLTGLREEDLRERYQDVGGLCLPHLRIATGRGGRRLAAWLAAEMKSRFAAGPPGLAVMAGDQDADADIRVRLRAALPVSSAFSPRAASSPGAPVIGDICPVCLTAAQAERDVLARATDLAASASGPGRPCAELCPGHLHEVCSDLAGGAGPTGAVSEVLALQAERSRAWLAELTSPAGPRIVLSPFTDRYRRRRRGRSSAQCPACRARHDAARSATGRLAGLRMPSAADAGARPPSPCPPSPCLRHVISLRQHDPRNADATVRLAARRAEILIAELEEAFRKRSWPNRHEARGPEMTAWRRAAALIDGSVFGGGPPGPL
jgi:hypothetical protein